MIIEFATKRDINGNRYYLGVDTDTKSYSRERGRWYSRADIIEISKKGRNALIDKLIESGYTEKNYMH